MDRKIFRLAIPNIISNITVPLIGLANIGIAGHLDSAKYIGAMSLGVTIFNMIYWNFSFLRMSTSGFTSQALGARNLTEATSVLLRSVIVSVSLGVLIILLQYPIGQFAFRFILSGEEIKGYVEAYFRICVWGAPAVLTMYAFNGWFIGMQNAKTPMFIAIFNNILNIGLNFTFVFGLGMDIEGIALGTLLSQIITLAVTVTVWSLKYGRLKKYLRYADLWNKVALRSFFKVNADVFVRMFLLTIVTGFFTFASSSMGDTLLAVNALLMEFFMLFSYFMDGFAYAGEALTGKFVGAGDRKNLKAMIRRLFFWGFLVNLVAIIAYSFFPGELISLLTDKAEVIRVVKSYTFWTVLIPITGFAAFLWDGVFIGATLSKEMRNTMIFASMMFFACYFVAVPLLGNNGLWLSFILYLGMRAFVQTVIARKRLKLI